MSGANFIDIVLRDAVLFNSDVSNITFPSSSYSIESFFRGATAFNQSLSDWPFTDVTGLNNFVSNTAMSSANYNGFLAQLRSESIGPGITFGMTLGADGLVATGQGVLDEDFLILNDGMTIISATP